MIPPGEDIISVSSVKSNLCLASLAAGLKTLGCVLLGKTCCTCLNGLPQNSAPFFKRTHSLCLFGKPITNKRY